MIFRLVFPEDFKYVKDWEFAVDIIFSINIVLTFFRKTAKALTLKDITLVYIKGYFILDILMTFPTLVTG